MFDSPRPRIENHISCHTCSASLPDSTSRADLRFNAFGFLVDLVKRAASSSDICSVFLLDLLSRAAYTLSTFDLPTISCNISFIELNPSLITGSFHSFDFLISHYTLLETTLVISIPFDSYTTKPLTKPNLDELKLKSLDQSRPLQQAPSCEQKLT